LVWAAAARAGEAASVKNTAAPLNIEPSASIAYAGVAAAGTAAALAEGIAAALAAGIATGGAACRGGARTLGRAGSWLEFRKNPENASLTIRTRRARKIKILSLEKILDWALGVLFSAGREGDSVSTGKSDGGGACGAVFLGLGLVLFANGLGMGFLGLAVVIFNPEPAGFYQGGHLF
jgi:hypothetical protein